MPSHLVAVPEAALLDATPSHGERGLYRCKLGSRRVQLWARASPEVQSTLASRSPAFREDTPLGMPLLRLRAPCILRPHPL
jgi:hypothetical protein